MNQTAIWIESHATGEYHVLRQESTAEYAEEVWRGNQRDARPQAEALAFPIGALPLAYGQLPEWARPRPLRVRTVASWLTPRR